MPKRIDPISNQLKGVAVRLKRWREAHTAGRRLPDEIWRAAVQAAREDGVYRTAHALRLDYGNLKRKVEWSTKARKGKSDKESIATGKTASDRSTEAAKKASVNRAAGNRGPHSIQPRAFMELIGGSIGGECVIEMEGAGKGRLRIQMKLTALDVINLVREWQAGAMGIGEGE